MRSKKNREQVIEDEQLKIVEWYETVSGKEPQEQYDNTTHTVTGPVRVWYLLPLLPNCRNPSLHIFTMGDEWFVKRVPIEKQIRSVGGI